MPRGFVTTQIELNIANGVHSDVAARFVRSLAFGGCTEAEALALIRDRDCAPYGTACELWDADDFPGDRWFRNAWVRSHNGGPISISLRLAKPIQWDRMRDAVATANAERRETFERSADPIRVDWGQMRSRIHAASDVDDLRRVWPDELRG
jgi:hypothetical protein